MHRISRFALMSVLLSLAALSAGCAAPSASQAAMGDRAGDAPPPPPAAPAAPPPPMSTPAPPRPAREAVAVITTCKTSADCAVKNVGNCCGAMPACVNKDSPTDPAAVQAQCNAKGMVGVCGFKAVSACQCDNGQCVDAGGADSLRGPTLPAEKAQ